MKKHKLYDVHKTNEGLGIFNGEEDVGDTVIMYLRRRPIETRLCMPTAA